MSTPVGTLAVLSLLLHASLACADDAAETPATDKRAFFGDLHMHTKNSLDAYMFRAIATPDDAYRYARGEEIRHPLGSPIQLRGDPLDFAAVTDHGELLGVLAAMSDPEHPASKLPFAAELRSSDRSERIDAFLNIQADAAAGASSFEKYASTTQSAWRETLQTAERYNQPGVFTTFVGYEYSSAPDNQNLHRNVIFASAKVPPAPFSAIDSENPEDLWHWMDRIRTSGIDAIAIPHNSNVSNGLMFQDRDWHGNPLDREYADLRMRNEPLIEVTQVKGTSETHPLLSPDDEWAGFELYDTLIASERVAKKNGGFARQAYLLGLSYWQGGHFNPYSFGMIGSTDTHNAGGAIEEDNYVGKVGVFDGDARRRGAIPDSIVNTFGQADAATTFRQWSASGLAGIWAEENTREALFAAMRRKETFATSGPRITLRFFAGFDYADDLMTDPDNIRKAYLGGVPMGGSLGPRDGRAPLFVVWAARDRHSAPLQRIQVIKGWIADGEHHERVFDIVCSDGRQPDSGKHRCADNGTRLDPADCEIDKRSGADELRSLWRDPEFDPNQASFYYIRVLENPSCRWSSWDALRAGAAPRPDLAATIQERAWSSPIWYRP